MSSRSTRPTDLVSKISPEGDKTPTLAAAPAFLRGYLGNIGAVGAPGTTGEEVRRGGQPSSLAGRVATAAASSRRPPPFFYCAMPPAASTASVTSSDAVDPMVAICTGFSMPISIGPITEPPPSSRSSLADRLADCRPGITSTLAGPDRRQNG